jgi:hypothetical protein
MVRRASIAFALVAVTATLTACGGVRSTVDPVAEAATKTQAAGGVAITLSASFGTTGHMLALEGRGSFDRDQGQLDLDLSKLLPQSNGLGGSAARMREVFLTENGDPVIYLDFPLFSGMLGGKSWLRIDLQQAGKPLGVDMSRLMKGTGQNPADVLALLKASGGFAPAGRETVDGVATTRYHGTIDLRKAVEQSGLPGEVAKRLADLGGPSELPYDVWVDDEGYVRRIAQRYDQTLGGITMSYQTTIGLSDYGKDVSVTAPPADQVFDATELAAKGASELRATTNG